MVNKKLIALLIGGGIVATGLASVVSDILFAGVFASQIIEPQSSNDTLIDEPSADTLERSRELTRCNTAVISIEEGNATSALLRQSTGNTRIANASVTWVYQNGNQETSYTFLETQRATGRANTDAAGTELESIKASPVPQDEAGCTTGLEVEQPFPLTSGAE